MNIHLNCFYNQFFSLIQKKQNKRLQNKIDYNLKRK
jgi:hypothetical protein